MKKEIIDKVKEIAALALKEDEILKYDDFNLVESANLDSVARVAILTALEDEYDFIFKIKEISSWQTINQLATIVEKHLS